ncbi:hypothetical protein LTS18_005673, partial [Coniosporium uncinatum]
LEDAEHDQLKAQSAARSHHDELAERATNFAREQTDIDRKLQIITRSETSDDAVQRFESSMDKLRRLDVLNAYVELLGEVDALSKECLAKLQVSDEAALDAYRRLQTLELSLGPLQDAAEGAAPHLLDHISKSTQEVHAKIRAAFSSQLEKVLKKIYWPNPEASIPIGLEDDWSKSVRKLLGLQQPELEAKDLAAAESNKIQPPVVLLPMQILVHPLEQRFRYHFDGNKPTNRVDRPEYFFNHVTDLLESYSNFMTDHMQPLLSRQFRCSDLAYNAVYVDATSAFITALLPMVRTKIFSLIPKVSPQPQLLSHLIDEVLKFDTTLREEWHYTGGYGAEGWKGLAWELLVQKDCFTLWLRVEKDFALARYETIISDSSSGELDFDSVDPGTTKPTKAAIRVNDLLETITDRYRPLTSFTQKLRFLIDIQIAILDRFHARLHSSLEAYLTMTSSLGRNLSGISREEQAALSGISGLDRLCRVYGSADYLERAMRDWSDDVFFLEMWEELQSRARGQQQQTQTPTGHSRQPSTLAGNLSVAEVAQRTSSAVGTSDADAAETGALFDETATAYSRLRVRSESIIIDVLTSNIRDALRAYRGINPWASLASSSSSSSSSSSTAAASSSLTPELQSLLTYLSESLSFLHRALAPLPLRRVVRHLASTLDEQLFARVLLQHSFST